MNGIDKDIGKHPSDPSFFFRWLGATNVPPAKTMGHKKYRSLTENKTVRDAAIDTVALWVITYHIRESTIRRLQAEKKRAIYKKYDYDKYLKAQHYLPQPSEPSTQSGALTEVVFTEYLKACSQFATLIYKLRYNSNTSQSMKGDDVLLFNENNLEEKIIYGECKFRSTPSKQAIDDILSSQGSASKMPVTMTFVAGVLEDQGQQKLSNKISKLQEKMKDGKIPIMSVGLMMSDQDTYDSVNDHDFYINYSINQEVIDELNKTGFNGALLTPLLGVVHKILPDLNEAINKIVTSKGLPTIKKTIKSIVKDKSNKSFNPAFSFVSISMDDPEKFVQEAYKKAEEYLRDIEKLKRPPQAGIFDIFQGLSFSKIMAKIKNAINV